jgi:PAS domain S-box-containing protein
MTPKIQNWRPLLVWAAAVASLLLSLAVPAGAQDLSQQEREYLARKGAIVFVSQTNYPPFEFIDADGNRAGMCVELARWMATTLGFQARFTDTSFKQAQEAVQEGRAEVITSLFYSPKRAQSFGFSQMTFAVPASIFVAAQRPDIKDIKDLAGKTIAMQAGDYAQEFLESQGMSFQTVYAKDFAEATNLVIAGQADAIIGDEQIVLFHIYSRHLTQRIKKVGEPLYLGNNCMATKAGDPVLVGILDKGLALAKTSGTLEQINRKWLGVHYRDEESFFARYRLYIQAGAGAMLLASLLVWIWNLQLRRLVRRRTADLARSEGTLKAILTASPVGIGLVEQGAMGWRNPAMDEMLGRPVGQGQDIPLAELFADEPPARLARETLEQALADGLPAQAETRWLRAGGQAFDCLVRIAPLDPGGPGRTALAIASDIGQRKQAESTLAESEAKYRALIETTDTGFVILDPEGRVLDANREYVRLSGHDSLEQIRGRSVLEWTCLQDVERNSQAVRQCLATGRARNLEIRYLVPSGGLRPLEINATVVEAGGQRVILSICRDISQRKQAEEALRDSEERLLLLGDNLPNVMVYQLLAGPGGTTRFTYVSGSVERLNELTPEEVLADANALYGQILPQYRAEMAARQAESLGGLSVFNMEVQALLPSGRRRWFVLASTPRRLPDGGVLWDGVEVDITERKQAEEALKASEEVKDLLLNASPDPFFLMNPQGVIRVANQALGQRLGRTEAELVGARAFDLIPPEVAALRRKYFDQALKTGQPNEFEDQWRGRHMHFRHIPILDGQGRVVEMAVFSRDITQRVRAEEELRKSEEKHRLVLEESSDPIFSFAPDGTYLYVNKAFASPFGKVPAEIIGKRIWDVFSQEEADQRFAAVSAVFASGETKVIEVRVPQPLEDLYFVTSVKPVKDSQGRVSTVICISKDITLRKRAEEALKESEERFRIISEESPLGISLLDHQGRHEYVNPAFVGMFGYTLDQVAQSGDWFRLAFPDPQYRRRVREDWLGDLRSHQPREVRNRTYQVTCRDGSQKTILFRPVTITQGRQFVIYEDVTQRLQALEALKDSERRYRELFDNMSDLIYTQDLQGRFLTVNPALAKLFGYPAEDLLGHLAVDFMRPELRQAFQTEYLDKLLQEGHHFGISMYFAKDGGRRYIEYHSSLVKPAAGPPYISGVGRDVTDRINAEKQLRRLQEQLFQSQKIQALGVLAGGIAHDFNNMLQSISGYTQLMLTESHTTPVNRDRLEHIEQSIARATGMIGHLMTLARKGQTKLERVDLNQEVARTIKILEHTLPKMISLGSDLAPDLLPVNADATQVEQILLNLSTNASQAMPQGGQLTFTTRNATIDAQAPETVPGLEPGPYVRLEVSDTGLGMDEETLSHIFEPFFTTKPLGQGTGLGLSTVYGIVTNYGGQILCASRPGRGTTFTIYLPALGAEALLPAPAPRPAPLAATGNETILVVDDEPAILDTCRQALEDCGYGVLTATSGETALDIYLGSPQAIGLVILDLSMPGMGGIKCLQLLLQNQPLARVLVATGYADEAVTKLIGELGARDIIGKPYRFQDLMFKVRTLLDA